MALRDWLEAKKKELETSRAQKKELDLIRQQAKQRGIEEGMQEAAVQRKELYQQQKADVYKNILEQEKQKILQEQLSKQQALDTRSGKEKFVEGLKTVGQKLGQASSNVGTQLTMEGKQLKQDITKLDPSKVTGAFNPVRRESYSFSDKLFQNNQQVNPLHLQGKGLDMSKFNHGTNQGISNIISDKSSFNIQTGSFNNDKLKKFFLK